MNTRVWLRLALVTSLVTGAFLGTFLRAPTAGAADLRLGKHYGGDFTLIDHEGRPYSLRDARGKVVLMHFGYTACDYTCPVTMAKVAAALERLGPRAEQVQPLMISIDTRRDSPAVLRSYVLHFHPAYVGLTGAQEQVEAVARQYRSPVHVHKPDHKDHYVADHGSGLYLVGRDGMLADIVFFDVAPEEIARRVEEMLKR